MYEFPENIRLIIWDMDETFWKGTLSEENIELPIENVDLIKELTNRGIINSICSKNNYENVKNVLSEKKIWDLFVFPKISWNPKGEQIKQLVEQVKLRPETILFIDDNIMNREEVKFYVPKINISGPDIIEHISTLKYFIGKKDKKNQRLLQYKILETKTNDMQHASSNEEFLFESAIQVKIFNDCENEIDRIYELVDRTNQLNYTKNKSSKDEIKELIKSKKIEKGYIIASDKYGKYGVVGFYAKEKNVLVHFLFSCRTLGLGIEQWVYAKLGHPKILVVGEVAVNLTNKPCPKWINNTNSEELSYDSSLKRTCLLIGGCDLEQVAYYIKSNLSITTRFNYMNGKFIVHPEHTELLRGGLEYSKDEKDRLVDTVAFYDKEVFNEHTLKQEYDIIVFSPLIDTSLNVYENIYDSRIRVVYSGTEEEMKNDKRINEVETDDFLKIFKCIGKISEERFEENLRYILDNISCKTVMILLNGSEQNVNHPMEKDRYLIHIKINKILQRFAGNNEKVELIDVSKLISSQEDHTDTIRHYNRKIYFEIAGQITNIVNNVLGSNTFKTTGKGGNILIKIQIKTIMRRLKLLDFAYTLKNSFNRLGEK